MTLIQWAQKFKAKGFTHYQWFNTVGPGSGLGKLDELVLNFDASILNTQVKTNKHMADLPNGVYYGAFKQ